MAVDQLGRTIVRCRFCEWARPLYWRNRKGKNRTAWASLRHHVIDQHPEEYADLQDAGFTTEEEPRDEAPESPET